MAPWYFCLLSVAVLAGLVGCSPVTPVLDLPALNSAVVLRSSSAVTLVMDERSRRIRHSESLSTDCIQIPYNPAPLGEAFGRMVHDGLGQMFVRIDEASSPVGARGEVVFVLELERVGRKAPCGTSPEAIGEVAGVLRAMDVRGVEIWRSQTKIGRVSRFHSVPGGRADAVGHDITAAMAKLTENWIKEIQTAPQFAAYWSNAPTRAALAPPKVAGPSAVPAVAPPPPASHRLSPSYKPAAPRPDDVAVIIGNGDYRRMGKDIPDVPPAHADAEAMLRYAVEALGIREGNIIHLKDATSAQLVRTFGSDQDPRGQLFDWVKPGRSRVFVYYSGHGAPGGDGGAYLVPSDSDGARIRLNGYPLAQLYANLARLPAESVTVVLEACFSGVSPAGTVVAAASPVYLQGKAVDPPASLSVYAAGAQDQMASWDEDRRNGLFTKYFLLAMSGEADKPPFGNGDGRVGVAELDAYLRETVTYVARRLYGRDQTATLIGGR